MNYAIEFLKQQKEIFYKEIKYTLNEDKLKDIEQKITDFNDALNKLTIPVVVPMLLCKITEKDWALTEHKKYEMLEEDKIHYWIYNDRGEKDKIFKQYFDKIPNSN